MTSGVSTAAPLEAVIFDLDDTLIDWWGSIERCLRSIASGDTITRLQHYCRERLWETRPGSLDIWHRNTWALHHHRAEHWPAALTHLDPTEVATLADRFDAELWVDFFPETVETLEALAADCSIAVMSNNSLLASEADRLGLATWFEVMVAAPRTAPKPAPEAFLTVASQLGLRPDQCAYVGDSVRADVLGARGVGMVPVWVNRWNDAWPERPADVLTIASLVELPDLVTARRSAG